MTNGSGDLLSHAPMHVGVWDGVDYDGGASCEMRQNPTYFFGTFLAAAGSYIYIRTRGGIVSRPQSQTDSVSHSYTYRTRNQKLVCQDIKNKTAKGSCAPARRRTGFRWTIHAHVACTRRLASPRLATARPGPARPGEARRASARVWFSLSLLTHDLEWWREPTI